MYFSKRSVRRLAPFVLLIATPSLAQEQEKPKASACRENPEYAETLKRIEEIRAENAVQKMRDSEAHEKYEADMKAYNEETAAIEQIMKRQNVLIREFEKKISRTYQQQHERLYAAQREKGSLETRLDQVKNFEWELRHLYFSWHLKARQDLRQEGAARICRDRRSIGQYPSYATALREVPKIGALAREIDGLYDSSHAMLADLCAKAPVQSEKVRVDGNLDVFLGRMAVLNLAAEKVEAKARTTLEELEKQTRVEIAQKKTEIDQLTEKQKFIKQSLGRITFIWFNHDGVFEETDVEHFTQADPGFSPELKNLILERAKHFYRPLPPVDPGYSGQSLPELPAQQICDEPKGDESSTETESETVQ